MSEEQGIFLEFLKSARPGIDAALDGFLPQPEGPAANLNAAMRYSVLGGGKRLRPALCLATSRIFGGDAESAMPVACSLEMIHAFTLIHDDLPCMDDDDLRRGRPTTHKVFGEAIAVLAGDALHNLGYQIITRHCIGTFDPQTARLIMEVFTSAVRQVCEGQTADIETAGCPPDAASLKFIHENKTAALISASVLCGALCAGAAESHVAMLTEFAGAAGLLFQNVDDILDAAGEKAVTGKSGPSDSKHKKLTTIAALGMEGAVELARKQLDLALRSVSGIPGTEVLCAFPDFVFTRIPEKLR
jgi:geranylgeranyl diphosphate synthase, type II